jgi:hypothetical protein
VDAEVEMTMEVNVLVTDEAVVESEVVVAVNKELELVSGELTVVNVLLSVVSVAFMMSVDMLVVVDALDEVNA